MKPQVLLATCLILLQLSVTAGAAPIPVLFDTDIMGDVDDVGAVAMLHALADEGKIEILGMGVSGKNPASPLCLDALNRFYGRPNLPLGVVKGPAFEKPSSYADTIAKEFPHRFESADQVPDVVKVYRKALADAKDDSVVLITVGQLPNVQNLLKSKPDEYSPLSGVELVKQKTRTWVCMGGKFPQGHEANIYHDPAPAKYAIDNWPGSIVFSGWEIGIKIITGQAFAKIQDPNPAKRGYYLYNKFKGRASWDQTAVLYAACGLDGGLNEVWDLSSPGRLELNENGYDLWHADSNGSHRYLIEKMPPEKVAQIIEKLMLVGSKETEKTLSK